MRELIIPDKLQHLVRFSEEEKKHLSGTLLAGIYDPTSDLITLNPRYATQLTVFEELFHRKQYKLLEKKGIDILGKDREALALYLNAAETGVIPRVRDLGQRFGIISASKLTIFERYFQHATWFVEIALKTHPDVLKRFFKTVYGEILFDGLAYPIMQQGLGLYDRYRWAAIGWLGKEKDNESGYWREINLARERWSKKDHHN